VVADADSRLVRCTETIPSAMATSYILVRRELKDTPRVRALIDFLVPYMQADMKVRLERGRQMRERDAANDGEAQDLSKLSPPA
jgi:hypothetical protein